MRGEQVVWQISAGTMTGSPPHARGAGEAPAVPDSARGITPACAGSRCDASGPACYQWDHPRMRGEQAGLNIVFSIGKGSPPHARGAVRLSLPLSGDTGITPACAGSSLLGVLCDGRQRDHPRMRGEQLARTLRHWLRKGSPPHARGAD